MAAMPAEPAPLTAYQLLGVHPAAPAELVNVAYWLVIADLQRRRSAGQNVDAALHGATRAYEFIADPDSRAHYDQLIGADNTPLRQRMHLPRKRTLFGRKRRLPRSFDCYAAMGLDESAPSMWVPEAYRIMRDQYLRARDPGHREALLHVLDESYKTLSNDERRAEYDAMVHGRQQPETVQDVVPAAAPPEEGRSAPSPPPAVELPDEPPIPAPVAEPPVQRAATPVRTAEPPRVSEPIPEPVAELPQEPAPIPVPVAQLPAQPRLSPTPAPAAEPAAPSPEIHRDGIDSNGKGGLGATAVAVSAGAASLIGKAAVGAVKISGKAAAAGISRLRNSSGSGAPRLATRRSQDPGQVTPRPSARAAGRPRDIEDAFLHRLASRVPRSRDETGPEADSR